MNDNAPFERFVADQFAREGRPIPADTAHDYILSRASQSRQRPRWLALIKEPPMRISSNLAVGSPTARIVAIMVATLLLAVMVAGAGIAGSQLLAADDTIVVDQSGSGTVETITEAVAMAEDGDTILVRPGIYDESVVIAKDITLRGEDRDGVVIQFGQGCDATCPSDTPTYPYFYDEGPFGVMLEDSEAEISHFTVRGPELPPTASLLVVGGGPFIHDIAVVANHGVYIDESSSGHVSDVDAPESWLHLEGDGPATIEDSTFVAMDSNGGGNVTIRNNHTAGINFLGPALVEDNTLVAPDEPIWTQADYGSGIDVQGGDGWIIIGNTITGFDQDFAINALGGTGEIVGNTVIDNRMGLTLGTRPHHVRDNTVTGGMLGISVTGGAAVLAGNTVESVSGRGIVIGGSATPNLSGNRSCNNTENLFVADTADPVIDDTNDICEDPQVE